MNLANPTACVLRRYLMPCITHVTFNSDSDLREITVAGTNFYKRPCRPFNVNYLRYRTARVLSSIYHDYIYIVIIFTC